MRRAPRAQSLLLTVCMLSALNFAGAEIKLSRKSKATSGTGYVLPEVNGIWDRDLSEKITSSTLITESSFDPGTMMKVEEIRPGMKGYGLSVFSGTQPERFEAEVIGVRHRMFAGTDIILCRLKHPLLEDIGVVAGMSGSPVYIDGKLIGAVAYGFSSVIEPLAGITPIEDMVAVYDRTDDSLPQLETFSANKASALAQFNQFIALKQDLNSLDVSVLGIEPKTNKQSILKSEFVGSLTGNKSIPDELHMEYLGHPLMLSSGNPKTLSLVKQLFPNVSVQSNSTEMVAASNWSPSSSGSNTVGGAIDLKTLSDEISEGYSLSVPFVEGDLNLSGTGTVTWRKENKLIAFGHPMFQGGNVAFPMAASRVSAIVRSSVRPFKLGEPLGQIGMIRQDRLPAIGGVFGETAKMFPVSVLVNDDSYLGSRKFSYRIWNDKSMLSQLLLTVLFDSLSTSGRMDGEAVAKFRYAFQLDDGTSITKSNILSDRFGAIRSAYEATLDLGILALNPYKEVHVKNFQFDYEVQDRMLTAEVFRTELDKQLYAPLDIVNLKWHLKQYREEDIEGIFSFKVPESLPDGDYEIKVMGGSARQAEEKRRNPGGSKFKDYNGLVRSLSLNFPLNKIYITLTDRDTGVDINGNEMGKLPGSIISTIEDTAEADEFSPVRGNVIIEEQRDTEMLITGSQSVILKVRRK